MDKRWQIAVIVVAGAALCFSVPRMISASTNSTYYGSLGLIIDTPTANQPVSGTISITGWALDNTTNPVSAATPITWVGLSIDGGTTQNITADYGANRPDVCAPQNYPGRPDCPNVGFIYPLDTTTLSDGPHTVTITATDSDPGSSQIGSRSVTFIVDNSSSGISASSSASSTLAADVSQACSTVFAPIVQEITGSAGIDFSQSELDELNAELNADTAGLCPTPVAGGAATSSAGSGNNTTTVPATSTAHTDMDVLGGLDPTSYLNAFIADLQSEGYTISENVNARGEIIGMASKNGQKALSFDLGDQVVSGYPMNTSQDSCTVNAPQSGSASQASTVPVLINTDGTIPHISHDFNVIVDPSAYSYAQSLGLSQSQVAETQNDLVNLFNTAYAPYTQVAGVPQPTNQPDAGAIVILAFADIPSTQYTYLDQNGNAVTTPSFNVAANTLTLLPGLGGGSFVPSGSAQIIADALNAGKQVAIITYNTAYFMDMDDATKNCVTEHEPGHFLGLDDNYPDGDSPMRGGDECSGGDGLIPISPDIAATLTNIQRQQTFTLNSCSDSAAIPLNTNSTSGIPPTDFVPLFASGTNPGSIQWVLPVVCTSAQLADGWVDTTGGCYHLSPTATSSIVFNDVASDSSTVGICLNDYGASYACSATSCGAQGQPSCSINIPAGTCLDGSGNQISCPNGIIPPPPITPPPAPTENVCSTGYQPASDGSCVAENPTPPANDYCAQNPSDPNCESYCASNTDSSACLGTGGSSGSTVNDGSTADTSVGEPSGGYGGGGGSGGPCNDDFDIGCSHEMDFE